MSTRVKVNQGDPEAYKAMLAFDQYVSNTSISHVHRELIKIRASQINGCAYCVDMHTRDAVKVGISQQRINAVSVWKDTPFFDEQERAILALTEEVTLIGNKVSDVTYNKAAELFEPAYLTYILMAIIVINAWNRIGVATHMEDFLKVV